MRMFEIMSEGVQTVAPTTAATDAWELMRQKGIHHLVVTDGREIVGVLSDRDAGGREGTRLRADRAVVDLMTKPVFTRAPTDTVRSVANAMRGRTIGCVPIVDRGRLVGIVTTSDLLEIVGRGADRIVRSAPRAATHWRVPHRKRKGVKLAW